MNQIELHQEIEKLVLQGLKSVKADYVSKLIATNDDAKQYFFAKADDNWLEWLWKNGFLDSIKEKAADPSSYGFRMPELNFLFSVTEKKPDIVANIICSVEISARNFNPEVVDQFTRIASKLPAKSLKKIVPKIRDEGWVKLMGSYTQYGFEYADMLKTLSGASDFESILILSEAILSIRSKEDIKNRKYSYKGDDVFYIHELSETNVFTCLEDTPDVYLEKALLIAVRAFTEAIQDEGNYLLIDEDFFTLKLGSVYGDHFREELKLLTATVIELIRKVFKSKSYNNREVYKKYFADLPKNQTTRRLRLFVLSLDPESFINELEKEYFKLFDAKKPMEVLYGAEYERALMAGFIHLPKSKKSKYISKVFDLFSNPKDDDDKRWKRHYASCILSTISGDLTKKDIALAKKNEYKIDANYQPEPSIGHVRGGTVTPRSPINSEDFSKLSVRDIADKLIEELSPEELQKRYKNDDFMNPRDADGVAEQLKGDIKNRLNEYLENAQLFFDREKLIPHYTNAFLRGIKETLSEKRFNVGEINYDQMFNLLQAIKKSGENESFVKNDTDIQGRWLSGWNSVHSSVADLIEELIKQKDKITLLNFKQYRKNVFEILNYLLEYIDPIPEDEKLKTAKMTSKRPTEVEPTISDPFSIAINSVRGRAFQVLLHFVYQDATNNNKTELADDVKALYLKTLEKEKTRSIMFMFGHYLPSIYYRDTKWTSKKFSEIFESKRKDKYLRLAVWEGYLSNDLYREIFFEDYLQKLYSKNISQKLAYPKQKFFKDPHESLAIHLALAFVNYKEFGFEHPIFRLFIKEADSKQLSEFVSFLGRSYIAGDNYSVLKDNINAWKIKRLMHFWDFMLKTKSNSSALRGFGLWVDVDKQLFDTDWLAHKLSKTLEITKGKLDWDYGLVKSIESISTAAPQEALKILGNHYLSVIGDEKNHVPIRTDKEWYHAFEILYTNSETKDKAYKLINKLIERGGRYFWELEDIIKKEYRSPREGNL